MSPDETATLIATGLFSDDASTRARARAALAAHPAPRVAAYFRADKRKVHEVESDAGVVKLLDEYAALGLDGFALAMAIVREQGSGASGNAEPLQFQGAVVAALRHSGREPEVFEALSEIADITLPPPKKALPPGLSRLRALRRLRIPGGSLLRADHVDELASIPQAFHLSNGLRDAKLPLWDAARDNVFALDVAGAPGNLSDASPLARWSRLVELNLRESAVTDLSPLRALALRLLELSDTRVVDLTPIARMTTLRELRLKRLAEADLTPVWGLTDLESLDLSHTGVVDLSPLRALTRLRSLNLWGASVASFEPLTTLPLTDLVASRSVLPDLAPLARIATLRTLTIYGAPPDAPGLDALTRERPDVAVSR